MPIFSGGTRTLVVFSALANSSFRTECVWPAAAKFVLSQVDPSSSSTGRSHSSVLRPWSLPPLQFIRIISFSAQRVANLGIIAFNFEDSRVVGQSCQMRSFTVVQKAVAARAEINASLAARSALTKSSLCAICDLDRFGDVPLQPDQGCRSRLDP